MTVTLPILSTKFYPCNITKWGELHSVADCYFSNSFHRMKLQNPLACTLGEKMTREGENVWLQ